MSPHLSRRQVITTAGTAAAATAAAALLPATASAASVSTASARITSTAASASAVAAQAAGVDQAVTGAKKAGPLATDTVINGLPVPSSWKLHPFDLTRTSLQPSLFTANRDRMLAYAKAYPADRILSNFRRTAGLDTLGATPPGGWDTETGNLRGHYSGHFLSLLAQAYAGTGDAVYKDKLDYIVGALADCQAALAKRVGEPAPPAPDATWETGRTGGALVLSGDGQYVGLPDATIDGLTDFSIATWVNLAENRTWARAFDFGTGTGVYMFLAPNAGGGPRFAITTGGSGNEQQISSSTPIPVGEWVHLAVTKQGETGTLYVNGVAVATNSLTLSPADLGAPKNNWIGRSQFGDANLKGSVDEFAIFDSGLSAADVAALAAGAGPAGTVAHYRFDEGSGTVVADSSGSGRDASVVTGTGGDPGPSFPGYLAAYPETQFVLLEAYTTYPAIWAPYYTCHKIMRGLLDAYGLTANQQALEVVVQMGKWVHSRLSKLPREQLDKMWALYIAGEYGGMNEVMADLYALTGNEQFLVTAQCFDNTALLAACAENRDELNGKHANQHIPQFIGYARTFDLTGQQNYYDAVANFFDMVVPHRMYAHGGTGQGEIFRARDAIAATIVGTTNAETCACYNMLKVAKHLTLHTGKSHYMDYYERGLVNQILGSRQNVDSTTDPLVTYMLPVGAGSVRGYGNIGTCCGGTGLENHTKYQDAIYFSSADHSALYVNLYIASTLQWTERGIVVRQTTDYPQDDTVRFTITGKGKFDLRLRVPSWLSTAMKISVNGKAVAGKSQPGTYRSISRTWKSGDTVTVSMPFALRTESAIDDPTLQSIAFGPVSLVATSADTEYLPVSLYNKVGLSGSLATAIPATKGDNTFTTNGLALRPLYVADRAAYHLYLRRSEPTIVFGDQDTGLANSSLNGKTFLDTLWGSAPFSSRARFVAGVRSVVGRWKDNGLLTNAQAAAIVKAAQSAKLPG